MTKLKLHYHWVWVFKRSQLHRIFALKGGFSCSCYEEEGWQSNFVTFKQNHINARFDWCILPNFGSISLSCYQIVLKKAIKEGGQSNRVALKYSLIGVFFFNFGFSFCCFGIVQTKAMKEGGQSNLVSLNKSGSQIRKPPHRKTSPLNWFPRKKVDSYLKRKIKMFQVYLYACASSFLLSIYSRSTDSAFGLLWNFRKWMEWTQPLMRLWGMLIPTIVEFWEKKLQ